MSHRSSGGPALDDELRVRLTALAKAIGEGRIFATPGVNAILEGEALATPAGTGGTKVPPSTIATATTNQLLARIAALTTELRLRSSALDDVDVVSARLLLSDLRVLTSIWQTLSLATRQTLDAAQAELDRAKGGSRSVADDSQDAR